MAYSLRWNLPNPDHKRINTIDAQVADLQACQLSWHSLDKKFGFIIEILSFSFFVFPTAPTLMSIPIELPWIIVNSSRLVLLEKEKKKKKNNILTDVTIMAS